MGRPRKHPDNASKQKAWRKKHLTPAEEAEVGVLEVVAPKFAKKIVCQAYAPHGTKCKFCGKEH